MDNYSNDIIPEGYSGQLFAEEPETQVKAKNQKRDDTLSQLPLLQEVIDRLDMRIAFYDSVDSIQVDIEADPSTFQKVHAANKLTRDNLREERNFIQSRIKSL